MSEEDYSIPIEKLYAVVELKVAGEVYATPTSTSWLKDVKRLISTEGKVAYKGNCLWPKHEERLNYALEKRSKPSDDWIMYKDIRILKFCRSLGRAKASMEKALNASDFSESDNNMSGAKRARNAVPRFDPSAETARKSQKRTSNARKNLSDADSEDSDNERPVFKKLSICQKPNGNHMVKSNGSSLSASDKQGLTGISDQPKVSEINNQSQDLREGSSHSSASKTSELSGTAGNTTAAAGKSGADKLILNQNKTVLPNRDKISVVHQMSALSQNKPKPPEKSQLDKISSGSDTDGQQTQDNGRKQQNSSTAGCLKSSSSKSSEQSSNSSSEDDDGSTYTPSGEELLIKTKKKNHKRQTVLVCSSDSEDSSGEAWEGSGQMNNLRNVTSGGSSQNLSISAENDNNSRKKNAPEAQGNDTIGSQPRKNTSQQNTEPLSLSFSPNSGAVMSTPSKAGPSGVSKIKSPWKAKPAAYSPRKSLFGRQSTGDMLTYKSFMREIVDLRRRLDLLKVTTNKIYNSVCPVLEVSQDNEDGRGMPSLSVNSFDDLIIWEQYLKDHDNEVHAVRLLAEIGPSSSVKDAVYCMMQRIITNKVASSMNLKGKNRKNCAVKKAKFQDSPSYVILLSAVKLKKEACDKEKRTFEYTVSLVDAALGKWLKDAPKRYLNDLKTQKVLPEDASSVPDQMYLVPPEPEIAQQE